MVTIDDLLGSSIECECGRTHVVPTRRVVIERGALARAPELIAALGAGGRVLIVADRRTWAAAGHLLEAALGSRLVVERCIVPDGPGGEIHGSVEVAGELEAAFPDRFDLYIAVGSGTINDLTKQLAHQRRRPYLAVPTAASMNGYTSSIVALLSGGLKTTGAASPPVAVLADLAVLLEAPVELTLAGLGDLVSKPYCGCDWWLASLLRDEPYCPTPARIIDQAFDRALDELAGLGRREEAALALLIELLLLSGITMTIAGSSSPASGGEHLVSHYWDMMNLRDGRRLKLHGAQVGVASLAMDALYREVLEADLAAARFVPNRPLDEERFELRAAFGSLDDAVWPEWQAKLAARSERDLELVRRHEDELRDRIGGVLEVGRRVRRTLRARGAPTTAADLGMPAAEFEAALRSSRMIRRRYTVLDLAAEVGVLDGFARTYPERSAGFAQDPSGGSSSRA